MAEAGGQKVGGILMPRSEQKLYILGNLFIKCHQFAHRLYGVVKALVVVTRTDIFFGTRAEPYITE